MSNWYRNTCLHCNHVVEKTAPLLLQRLKKMLELGNMLAINATLCASGFKHARKNSLSQLTPPSRCTWRLYST